MDVPSNPVIVGKLGGAYGIKGWVKVISHTRPEDALLDYRPWYVKTAGNWRIFEVEDARYQGKGLVAKFSNVDDRDAALLLRHSEISIDRSQLAELPEDEYYWSDLTGLAVVTSQGIELGVVDHLLETGANDVLVVKGDRERLVPFVQKQFILEVDLSAGRILVEWDPEF